MGTGAGYQMMVLLLARVITDVRVALDVSNLDHVFRPVDLPVRVHRQRAARVAGEEVGVARLADERGRGAAEEH